MVRRKYADSCGMAQALNVVGERWALLVVRELLLGPKRFSDLRADVPGISPNVLTERLEELGAAGVLVRRRLPPPAASWVYELTEWGLEIEPIVRDLGRWGARSPFLDRTSGLSATSLVLSLRTMFHPERASDLRVALVVGEQVLLAVVDDGVLSVTPDPSPSDVAATLHGAPGDLAAVIYDGRTLDDALAAGDVRLDGDRAAVRRFLASFALPEQAPAPA